MLVGRAELAWAAGFFDGEGTTIARGYAARPGYRQLSITVPQACREGVPPVLLRFQRAMLGMGHITGPEDDGMYVLRFGAREEARLVLELLWPYLGRVKRAQATRALSLVDLQYSSGSVRALHARKQRPQWEVFGECSPAETELAWAAGFLDAEGCFGLNRGNQRARGPVWYRIRCSADQHGEVGIVPEVLIRLQRALGGIGRSERHGSPDDYKWCVEGTRQVERVIELTGRWLGAEKREEARLTLARFASQIRLKGNATHCVRGHLYTGTALKGGRMRRICKACARITDRARRAARGIAPRRFKDPSRRYT